MYYSHHQHKQPNTRMRLGTTVAIGVVICSCSTPSSPTPRTVGVGSERWFTRSIVHNDGRPAAMGLVILTDLQTEEQIAVATTNLEGQFKVPLSARNVALTATAGEEVAYVSNIDRLKARLHNG